MRRIISVEEAHAAARREEYYFEPPAALKEGLAALIQDRRDLPLLFLFFNIAALTLPGAALALWADSHLAGFVFWLTNAALFQERFLIGLHFASHRRLFRSGALNAAACALLSPFFGVPSGLYHLHHVVMHHSENNLDGWDLSSTEGYQRDSVGHFLAYWLRFLCLIWFELPRYALRRGRLGLAVGASAAVVCFAAAAGALCWARPRAAFWLVVWPTVINSLLLMLGNWSQHIFVDPQNPRSNYRLAYTVINAECNRRTFNDGFHVEHHLHSRRHWSELPASFVANLHRYAEEDAIVFERLGPMQVGGLVFLGRYDVLARHLVQLRDPPPRRSVEEVEAFLRSRLVPIRRRAS